ncbi:hypothetical protein [Amycolatopsis sp. NPDC051071]
MAAQLRIWVVTDDFDPCGIAEAGETANAAEPRRSPENLVGEHVVLGYS